MMHDVPRIAIDQFRANDLPRGSKRRLELVIDHLPDGQHLAFPAVVVRGTRPGKTLLASGAVHGDEYEGTIAVQDLYEKLRPETMQGTFVGIPVKCDLLLDIHSGGNVYTIKHLSG